MESWIRKQVLIDRPEGRCTRLVVKHVSGSRGGGNEIASIVVPDGVSGSDDWISSALSEIETSAHTDAGGLGGPQKYMVYAFFSESESKPLARFPFLEHATDSESEDDGELESEPPTTRGLTSQLMRHNEALMRTSVMGFSQMMGTLQRQLAKQADVIEKLVNEKFETLDTIEELLTKKQERDIEAKSATMKQDLMEEAGKKLLLLAPMVVNKLVGKTVLPQKSTPRDEILRNFLGSLNQDQLMAMSGILSPEQQAAIMEIGDSLEKEGGKTNERDEGETASGGSGKDV
jgi:hypothetical protein